MVDKKKQDREGLCGLLFLRNILTIFNIIFFFSGAVFLAVGIWTMVAKHTYVALLTSGIYATTTYMFIAIGVIVMALSILGCIGVFKDHRGCLLAYAFLLLVVFLLEAISGILAYMYQGAIHKELVRHLNNTMQNSYMLDLSMTKAIDDLEVQFACCGAVSFEDWDGSKWQKENKTLDKVPESCCISPSDECSRRSHPSNIYTTGCIASLEGYLRQHLIIIGGIALGLCCLQIFGIIFACCLAQKIKKYRIQKM